MLRLFYYAYTCLMKMKKKIIKTHENTLQVKH